MHEIARSCRANADEIDRRAEQRDTGGPGGAPPGWGRPGNVQTALVPGEIPTRRAMGLGKLPRATIIRDGAADFDCYIAAREMGATHEEALLLSPHPEIRRLEWWQRDLILKALRSLGPKQWSPEEVELICGLSARWDNSPRDLAEAACKTTR